MKSMKYFLLVLTSLLFVVPAGFTAEPDDSAKACSFKDQARLNEHVTKHITYPATGKVIKEACKKEMPEEFSKEEHQCVERKLSDTKTYKSADEVLKDLGVKAGDKGSGY